MTFTLACGHLAVYQDGDGEPSEMLCPVCNTFQETTGIAGKPKLVTPDPAPTMQRSYGCSFGCGNPYDYVIVQVVDGTTEFACLPCFVKLASDMVAAVTEGISEGASLELAELQGTAQAPMTNGSVRGRGKNAPANIDDPDLLEVFDSRVTVEELGDEFK